MNKPTRLIIDAMIFGKLSYDFFNDEKNDLTNNIIKKNHVVMINNIIHNNYEGYFNHRGIPERIANTIKNRYMKHLKDNNVLKGISQNICNKQELKVKVPRDDRIYFKAALAARSKDKFNSILLTEDPNWHKIAGIFRKKHKVNIYTRSYYLS